jgi:hypothetical protein
VLRHGARRSAGYALNPSYGIRAGYIAHASQGILPALHQNQKHASEESKLPMPPNTNHLFCLLINDKCHNARWRVCMLYSSAAWILRAGVRRVLRPTSCYMRMMPYDAPLLTPRLSCRIITHAAAAAGCLPPPPPRRHRAGAAACCMLNHAAGSRLCPALYCAPLPPAVFSCRVSWSLPQARAGFRTLAPGSARLAARRFTLLDARPHSL